MGRKEPAEQRRPRTQRSLVQLWLFPTKTLLPQVTAEKLETVIGDCPTLPTADMAFLRKFRWWVSTDQETQASPCPWRNALRGKQGGWLRPALTGHAVHAVCWAHPPTHYHSTFPLGTFLPDSFTNFHLTYVHISIHGCIESMNYRWGENIRFF